MSFTVYKSSAGSGKTYTLVREYLKIILTSPKDFREVLAITFTNKAANEMKQRILLSLQDISAFETNPESIAVKFMLPELIRETGYDENRISINAKKALQLILHNYSDFGVSTIDSFVYKIVRTFAHDMHLPLNFEVEMDSGELIAKAVDILISNVGKDNALTEVLVNFTKYKTEGEKSWHIEKDLADISNEILTDDGQANVEKLKELSLQDFSEIRHKLEFAAKSFEKKIIAIAGKGFKLIDSLGLGAVSFYQGTRGIYNYIDKLSTGNLDKIQPNRNVVKTIEEDKWTSAKASASDKASINSIKSELILVVQQVVQKIENEYPAYLIRLEILKNLYPLALLNEIEKVLDEYKEDNEIIHISEFNKRIAEIVLKEPIPFIYERMGERYKHFMLDEFQDTSVLQWQNLLPLLENSLAVDNFNMLVGDGKQAIYRWRGGEVEQFSHLPKLINTENNQLLKERELSLERSYREKFLGSNFRSKAEIVQFNNDFFRIISGDLSENLASIYDNLEQDYDIKNTGGFVQIKFLLNEDSGSSIEELYLNEIVSVIDELRLDGFILKDVAVLCRDNKKASLVATHLLQNNINVISSESLLISNSGEVRFLFAFVKCLVNSADYIAQVEVVSYLNIKNLIHGEIHGLILKITEYNDELEGKGFWELLRSNGFDFQTGRLLAMPAYDLFEELIRKFGLNKYVDPYLQFLLDAVLDVSVNKFQGLSEILEWWEKKKVKLSIIVPEGVDAVRVMTTHKAKGLEFPVVIYPFANEKQRKGNNKLWININDVEVPNLKTALVNTSKWMEETDYRNQYMEEDDKSLLDLINLLYVTLTRPTDRLYVISPMPPLKTSAIHSVPQFFKQFLLEKGLWDDVTDSYNLGKLERRKVVAEKPGSKSDFFLDEFISVPWHDRMLLSLQAPEHWDMDEVVDSVQYGKLVHFILSKIITSEDVSIVIGQLLNDGVIGESESVEILNSINNVLDRPEVSRFFQKGLTVKTEAGILSKNGKSYRPDRVVIGETEVAIIDFKTGKREKKHQSQLNKYKELLLEMGYVNVKGFLLYLNEDAGLVEV